MAQQPKAAVLAAAEALIQLGKEQGFVAQDDIIQAVDQGPDLVADDAGPIYDVVIQAGIEVHEDTLLSDRGRRVQPLDANAGEIDDTISLYLREIGAIPLLKAEDERYLAKEFETGLAAAARLDDPEQIFGMEDAELRTLRKAVIAGEHAQMRLIQANSRLVVHIAKKYINNGVPFQDLIQEGNLGLMRAVEKFDYKKGFKFSTYATWWIRQAITRALADQSRTIRVPVHMAEQISKLMAITRRLEQTLGRDPTTEEIASEMDTTPEKVQKVLQISRRPISLEMPVGEESDSEYGDFLPDKESLEPNELAGRELLREEIERVLGGLSEREAQVLELRYGLHDGTPHTLEEVGNKFGVTRERIRQIETKAIRRLRHPTRSNKLRDYLR